MKFYPLTLVAQRVKHLPAIWETWVQSLGPEDPLEKEMATTPVFLPRESHEQRSVVGYSPWGSLGKNTGVVAMPSSRGSSQPRGPIHISGIAG